MGFLFIFAQTFFPTFSDQAGRKPALLLAYLGGILCPLGMWLLSGNTVSVVLYCLCGGMVGTTSALYGNVIPMEALPDRLKASASGIIMGIAEILGGCIWPLVASRFSHISPVMAVTTLLILCALACVMLLPETNRAVAERKKKAD